MALSVYTRHTSDCDHKDDINWRRCRCRKWIQGIPDFGGGHIRVTAKTRSWEAAERKARSMEDPSTAPVEELVTIEKAVGKYISNKKTEGIADVTLDRVKLILEERLVGWLKERNVTFLSDVTLAHLEDMRGGWTAASSTKRMMQERVKGFFTYCVKHEWIKKSPAAGLTRIKVSQQPTDYFPPDEFAKIVDATYVYNPKAWNTEPRNQATRVRALIFLLRWSGLGISDAVGLERNRLNSKDEILLRRTKSGANVYVPIPKDVAQALREIPDGVAPNPRYFFWSGNGKLKSAVADWQRSLTRVFKLAEIKKLDGTPKRCHPHMFRDTFAVECLLAGVPLDQVSILLGHSSVKITEQHYAPWVLARQNQLTSSVRQAWAAQGLSA